MLLRAHRKVPHRAFGPVQDDITFSVENKKLQLIDFPGRLPGNFLNASFAIKRLL